MNLEEQIEDAKQILSLPYNWDDEEAIPPTKENFDAAVYFCLQYYEVVKSIADVKLMTPYISQGNDGSVDVYFNKEDRKISFLINFPNTNYYGHNTTTNKEIKGKYNKVVDDRLLIWMAENLSE